MNAGDGKRDKTVKSPLGDIPHPFASHDEVFRSPEEAKLAIRGILRSYFGKISDAKYDYLFFKGARVRFEKNPQIDVEFDHRERTVIFVVKEPMGRGAEKLKAQIRREISLEYAATASDSRGRTAISIYRSLDQNARQAVLAHERKQQQ